MVSADGAGGGLGWLMGAAMRQARDLTYRLVASVGLAELLRRRARGGITILMYHRVLPAPEGQRYLHGLSVTPASFEAQVRWLASRCEVVTVRRAMERLQAGRTPLRRPLVCITFDDGYWDNAVLASPILASCGVSATFYLSADFVLHGRTLWFDRAAEVWQRDTEQCREAIIGTDPRHWSGRKPGFADWMSFLKVAEPRLRSALIREEEAVDAPVANSAAHRPMSVAQARVLLDQGHEIGSHTVTHPILTQLGERELRFELEESKRSLENALGAPVIGLAYPNGSTDARVAGAATAAGYLYACSTRPGLNRPPVNTHGLMRNHVRAQTISDRHGAFSAASFAAVTWGMHAWLRRAGRSIGIVD